MNAADRIRRTARAVAEMLGHYDHARYLEIVAVVLYADEAVNNLEEWGALTDPEFKRAAIEGVADIAERAIARKRTHAKAA